MLFKCRVWRYRFDPSLGDFSPRSVIAFYLSLINVLFIPFFVFNYGLLKYCFLIFTTVQRRTGRMHWPYYTPERKYKNSNLSIGFEFDFNPVTRHRVREFDS